VIEHIRRLREFYGLLPTPPGDLFQFFLWEVLSRDAIPARRDLAWQALKRIPALTPDAVFRAPAKALLDAVGMTGPRREEKVEAIRAMVGEFKRHRDEFGVATAGRAPIRRAARALRRLSHVPVSLRHHALLFAGGYPVIPMDDDVARVVTRFAGAEPIVTARRPQASDLRRAQRFARGWLIQRLPAELEAYRVALVFLRHHAQHTCVPVGPHCTVCPLREDCAAGAPPHEDRSAPA
jgi:endonuclease III